MVSLIDQDSSVDQLIRERPGCLLRSSDPEAELRYLVEALRSSRTGGDPGGPWPIVLLEIEETIRKIFKSKPGKTFWESWDFVMDFRMILIKSGGFFSMSPMNSWWFIGSRAPGGPWGDRRLTATRRYPWPMARGWFYHGAIPHGGHAIKDRVLYPGKLTVRYWKWPFLMEIYRFIH